MADVIIDESSFVRSAGRQLLVYGIVTVLGFALLMWLLDALASLVGSSSETTGAVDAATGTITLYLDEEPPQLDSTLATDQVSGRIIGHVMEGLLRKDELGNIVGGVAESWTIDADKAVFNLRAAARWSDGKPVTAHDFIFAWQRTLDPATASEYAFILYYIKNAEAINRGEMPPTALGVSAPDERTLVVELERPVLFFDKLVSFPTYYPVREDFFKATNGRYGADADTLLYNGPFVISSWVHGASLRMDRNESYWRRDEIRLNTINWAYITSDANAQLNFFKDGKVAYAGMAPESLSVALENRWHLRQFQDGGVFFIEFNHRPNRLTRNLHLRRALLLVNNSSELVNKVTKLPGYLPTNSLFPAFLDGLHDKFRREHPAKDVPIDVDQARRELELARKELGLEKWPPLSLLTGDNPIANLQSEYYQSVFKDKLGLDVRIDRQIFKQRLQKMTSGDFDMVMAGWGPDYEDLLTFGDFFASWNLNNRGRYDNPEYDALVRKAQASLDQAERVALFARMQDIIVDDAVILPNYEKGASFVTDPRLKGLVRRVVGADPDYTYAWIEESAQ
ncbi:MAG: peptide ABC transporter substrate-binding protein [Pseudomonadales bacterium]